MTVILILAYLQMVGIAFLEYVSRVTSVSHENINQKKSQTSILYTFLNLRYTL